METQIIFNGKQYASPEAMPPDVREAYQKALAMFADADKNGIPDVLEGKSSAGTVIGVTQSSIKINGREYKGVGDMPPFIRTLFENVMQQVGQDQGQQTQPSEEDLRIQRSWSTNLDRSDQPGWTSGPLPMGKLVFAFLLGGLVVLFFWWLRAASH